MRWSLVLVLVALLLGCGGGERAFREGRVYVVNNTGWRMNLGNSPCGDLTDRYILIDWEGMEVKVPPNMDCDGNPTGVGAVELTSEPLPGGTEVDFTYYFFYVGDRKPMKLSEVLARVGERAIVDGDITIELYASSADVVPFGEHWARVDIVPIARIIKGKFDGIHIY